MLLYAYNSSASRKITQRQYTLLPTFQNLIHSLLLPLLNHFIREDEMRRGREGEKETGGKDLRKGSVSVAFCIFWSTQISGDSAGDDFSFHLWLVKAAKELNFKKKI